MRRLECLDKFDHGNSGLAIAAIVNVANEIKITICEQSLRLQFDTFGEEIHRRLAANGKEQVIGEDDFVRRDS